MWWVLAEQLPEAGTMTGVGGLLVGGGFALWYGWYVTTKTIPEQNRKHAEAMLAQSNEFKQDVTGLAKLFESRLERICEDYRADLKQMWAEAREDRKLDRDARHEFFNRMTPIISHLESQMPCER